ncbi:MAG TPA: hypothetical protein VFG73_08540 [Rhodanobacteraceae bacterium]|nr:hypothetical protein [Rhodanobacteraceae bacterium]
MIVEWYDILGLAGVLLIVLAFFGLQAGRLRGDGHIYQVCNGLGAAAILVSLVYDFNLPSLVMEALWLVISIYGMVRTTRRRRARKD